MRSFVQVTLAVLAVTVACGVAAAQTVAPIGPFSGDGHENFDNLGLPNGAAVQTLDIFGGAVTVRNLTSGGSIKFSSNSTLGGDTVICRSGQGMIGQLGISEWDFHTPVTRFGGYWENNSRFDDATVDFFDTNNNLIASLVATDPHLAQAWTWNGWQSSVPLGHIVVTGNDAVFLHGFIWYDDMEASFAPSTVPEPSTLLLVGCASLTAVWWKRQQRRRTVATRR